MPWRKSPIKLKKYDFHRQYNNTVIKKHTIIENHPATLQFVPSESLQGQITIDMIKNISPLQLVKLKAKVTKLTPPKAQKTEKGKHLTKASTVLVDLTGSDNCIFFLGRMGQLCRRKCNISLHQLENQGR